MSRVSSRATDADELIESISHEVSRVVPFDSSMWFGVDPATLLAMAPARIDGMDEGFCATFWHGEFHEQDVVLFRDLARSDVPAATLRSATDGHPVRSPRFRDFMRPQGWDDELRVVFRSGDKVWGIAGLYRDAGRPAFTDDDVATVAATSSIVGDAIRGYVTAPATGPTLTSAPGLLLFDGDGTLTSANAEATRWLEELFGPGGDAEPWLLRLADPHRHDTHTPVPLFSLLARAQAVAAGAEDTPARLRLRDASGRWLVLHASTLAGSDGDQTVAVVVEPAKSAEIAPIVIDAYGLSRREQDVVRGIAQGLSTPAIAEELFLSAHTVRDYIKSVFEKVGVTSRGELVAKFFAEHYSDPVHEVAVEVH